MTTDPSFVTPADVVDARVQDDKKGSEEGAETLIIPNPE